ncbi:MAG: methionyl-tRNA formyltransferase, partial [Planctomycetota bacterium]
MTPDTHFANETPFANEDLLERALDGSVVLRIILMGTGPFAVPTFDAIRQSRHEVSLVVTKPEPPVKSRKGPPPAPVRIWAQTHALPLADPPSINDEAAIERLKDVGADLLVVCDYGQILKPDALASAALGGVNLHGSLLPAYRGAAPVQRALLSGDPKTGVTVIHMTPRLDAGPILGRRETPIEDRETAGELEERLSELGVELTLGCLEQLESWDRTSPIGETQEKAAATKAPRLSKQEARMDWTRSQRELDCHVRGMQPWPIAFCEVTVREGKPPVRLSILEVQAAEADPSGLSSGELFGGEGLVVAVGDGALELKRVRPAGKRDMTGEEFQRGYKLDRGTRL